MSLRDVEVRGRYRGPEDKPLQRFLMPMLREAVRYDRAAGYFSSTSLAAAATGLEPFLGRGGRIRMVVNHHLSDDDVDAVTRGLDLREIVQARLSKASFSGGTDAVPEIAARFRLLCSLVALRQLDLKVAVPTGPDDNPLRAEEATRLHHAKFGVFSDDEDPPNCVAFEGSNNETASGWLDNYESYLVSVSWKPDSWNGQGRHIAADFERHWEEDPPQGWAVVDLPTAARDGLIARADRDLVREALEAQGRMGELDEVMGRILAARGEAPGADPTADVKELLAMPGRLAGVGIATSVVEPWPHQFDVARKVVSAWPCSRMFSDEVGLGKTIEVGLVLRELLASEKAKRVLVLVPASVLWQWQTELWEKFALAVPVLDGARLVWPSGTMPEGEEERTVTGNRWDAADVMLASSHLARRRQERQHLIDRSWDLVVVDEAHHARRRGSKATKDDPNALLQLLRRMRDSDCWQGLLLATATPMQMHPHEAYDLLAVLGLPGPDPENPDARSWEQAGAEGFTRYYEQLTIQDPEHRDWRYLRALARSHEVAWPGHNPHLVEALDDQVESGVVTRSEAKAIPRFASSISDRKYRRLTPEATAWLDAWLREHTPMRTLVHRNTRHLLRAYQHSGILKEDVVIPHRSVRDLHVKLDATEQELYDRIESWIRDRYQKIQTAAAQGDRKAKAAGFIMTVYRRRLTSSFRAIETSLSRRRTRLDEHRSGMVDLASLLDDDDRSAIEDIPDDLEGFLDTDEDGLTGVVEAVGDEIEELDNFLAALASRPSYDVKLQRIIDDLRTQLGQAKPDGHNRQAVIFTQFTDTMDALRAQLATIWGGQVACYSGRGGEVHVPGGTAGAWKRLDKADLKRAFRAGDFRILVGTDAMSEGLNLQTCDLLYNLDLPWNFMRVEQRIGRIDRIGGYPNVHIVNMLIDGTVEERIYSGIKHDFGDFESIVGAAQPVLAQTEDAILTAALASGPDRDQLLAHQAQALIDAAGEARQAPVNLETFETDQNSWRPAAPLPGEVQGLATPWPDVLRETLTTHPVIGDRFQPGGEGIWRYEDERGRTWLITFDSKTADASAGSIGLFVWGHPAFPRGSAF